MSFKKSFRLLLLCLFAVITLSFIVYYINTGNLDIEIVRTERYGKERLYGIFGGGLVGIIAGFTFVLAVISIFFKYYRFNFFPILCIAFSVLILLFSDNRTGMIISTIACLYIVAKNFKYLGLASRLIIIILLSLAVVFFINYSQSSIGGIEFLNDFALRVKIWDVSFQQVLVYPWTGMGNTDFFLRSSLAIAVFGYLSDAHNAYLNLLLQSGFIVFILLMYFLFKLLLKFKDYNKRVKKISGLYSIPFYWFAVALTGATYFNFAGTFDSYLLGISLIGLLLHPEIALQSRLQIHNIKPVPLP